MVPYIVNAQTAAMVILKPSTIPHSTSEGLIQRCDARYFVFQEKLAEEKKNRRRRRKEEERKRKKERRRRRRRKKKGRKEERK